MYYFTFESNYIHECYDILYEHHKINMFQRQGYDHSQSYPSWDFWEK